MAKKPVLVTKENVPDNFTEEVVEALSGAYDMVVVDRKIVFDLPLESEFWNESPIEFKEYEAFKEYEDSYANEKVSNVANFAEKAKDLFDELTVNVTVPSGLYEVKVKPEDKVRTPATGEVKECATARIRKKVQKNHVLAKEVKKIASLWD